MDLLFKRYASPFLFMGEMLKSGRFDEFVVEFITALNTEKEDTINWDFYLHKVSEGSFSDFINEIETNKQNQNMTAETMEEITRNSFDILNNFTPEEGSD